MCDAMKIIGPSVIGPVIRQYEEIWKYRWPYDRRYVAELVIEVKLDLGMQRNDKTRSGEVRDRVLDLMRETHHFPDFLLPFGSGIGAAAAAGVRVDSSRL